MSSDKAREGGVGIANMRHRAEKLRGSFDGEAPHGGNHFEVAGSDQPEALNHRSGLTPTLSFEVR